MFLFYRTQVNLVSDLWVRMSIRQGGFWDFTNVTLIPDIFHFLYTGRIFRFLILHAKIPKIYPKKSKMCSFCVQTGIFCACDRIFLQPSLQLRNLATSQLCNFMDESGWKWMKMDESGWKWMKVDESKWKWTNVDENGWKWMKMYESRKSGWKWKKISAVLHASLMPFSPHCLACFKTNSTHHKSSEHLNPHRFKTWKMLTVPKSESLATQQCKLVLPPTWAST